jgi:poly-gamma-glutamate capsule biosynthesis protein CapA/YwtB (metallophosphatase superfamily)
MSDKALTMYDQQVPYAAIDAGADLILGGHAHILKGVEYYKGKPIFHGLGNFIVRAQQVTKSQIKFDDKMQLFTGHYPPGITDEINRTIIVKCRIENGKIHQVRYLPCLINSQRQPEILKQDERGQVIFDYMDSITREAGLNVRFMWDGDEVVVQED